MAVFYDRARQSQKRKGGGEWLRFAVKIRTRRAQLVG